MAFARDLQFALRSLTRAKGLTLTVVLTLALGIGANAAIVSLVRGVLLRPLVNRDEDRLIYIRQTALGIGADNAAFSVPELQDLRGGVTSLTAFGDFSTVGFTMVGLGEPRVVRAGVVGGFVFRGDGAASGAGPVARRARRRSERGRRRGPDLSLLVDDAGSYSTVLGKTIRLDTRSAVVVGVLEPSVPYPAETEIIANVVTSPHHLSATMVTGRIHRMTELFGRLAPGATLESTRAELRTVHAAMVRDHPESYSPKADFRIEAVTLRDQVTSRARTVLLVLLAASALVFVIAVSNVANLILARTVRREGELAIRAALGASRGALRRTLLAESLLLCSAGALLGVLSARPIVVLLAQYASRYSVRALDLTVDASMLWVGAALALAAAVLLAFVPRLPNTGASAGLGLSSGSLRITGSTTRRLQMFATTQIAASFVLLAGAGMLLTTLMALQAAPTGLDLRNVLALDVPVVTDGTVADQKTLAFYREALRRIAQLPGVDRVAIGTTVPWRDAGNFGPGFEFSGDGHVKVPGEEDPRARFRTISPGFFASLGVPIIAGRDFTDADRQGSESVVIVSQSVAKRLFPNQDAVNRHVMWTDPVMKFINVNTAPRRIVGVSADLDDENIVPGPALSIYHPFEQEIGGGRLFVHTKSNAYALVPSITRIIRELAADQPVERAATLEDVRATVLAPDRLNTLVFGGFAAVALAIAVVGVAGVLAFSVSGRTREFGVRLAIGSQPRQLLTGVLREGAVMASTGVVAGALAGFALARIAGRYVTDVRMPGITPLLGAGLVLLLASIVASVLPAARAARVDVMKALRAD